MKKVHLSVLAKDAAAFTAGAITVPSSLMAGFEVLGIVDFPVRAYLGAPLILYGLLGIRVLIGFAERVNAHANPTRQRSIKTDADISPKYTRKIPYSRYGKLGTLMASSLPFVFSEPDKEEVIKSIRWRVTFDNTIITIREREMLEFLNIAHKRKKHQFSRNYWTKTRRPPLRTLKYNAYMYLLSEAEMIANRTSGASGYLRTKPRHAITYLKHQSRFRL